METSVGFSVPFCLFAIGNVKLARWYIDTSKHVYISYIESGRGGGGWLVTQSGGMKTPFFSVIPYKFQKK